MLSHIQSLRAYAFLSVFFYHCVNYNLSGGYKGVDIFFVLSGFLITAQIQRYDSIFKYENLKEYLTRRVLRILPAYLAVCSVTLLIAPVLLYQPEITELTREITPLILFYYNIFAWQETGYFQNVNHVKPFIHFWTLSVEVQFYFIFGLISFIILKIMKRQYWNLIVIATLFSFLLSVWASEFAQSANFYLLPTRLWEFGVGALNYYLIVKKNLFFRSNLLGWIGIVLIVTSFAIFDENSLISTFNILIPVIGTSLILINVPKGFVADLIFRNRMIISIGNISYSSYLWHQVLLAFTYYHFGSTVSPVYEITVLVTTLALGAITYHYIETRFREGKLRLATKYVAALVSSSVIASVWFYAVITEGKFSYTYTDREVQIFNSLSKDQSVDQGACIIWSDEISESFIQRVRSCGEVYDKGVLVFGDSHAGNFFRSLAKSNEFEFIVGLTAGGCRLHKSDAECYLTEIKDFLSDVKDLFDVVLYKEAGFYLFEHRGKMGDRQFFQIDNIPVYNLSELRINTTKMKLDELNNITRIKFVGPWVEPNIMVHDMYINALKCRSEDYTYKLSSIKQNFLNLNGFLKNLYDDRYIEIVGSEFTIDNSYLYDCSGVYWRDGDHLSWGGEYKNASFFANLVNQ